jgi:hypothetical protein
VENYKKYLVLAKDNSNLTDFAKRQETIFQLENARSDAFNVTGPTSRLYIKTSNKLYDLYFEEEEYEEALDIAKELFNLIKSSPDIKLKSKIIVNLGFAYLKNGNISKAKEIASTYTFDEENPEYPYYCLFRAALSQVYKDKHMEISYLQNAYKSSVNGESSNSEIANILIAIALYYERTKSIKSAYMAYLEIFHKATELSLELTDEERFSFLIRLSTLAIKNDNNKLALDLLTKSTVAMNKKLGTRHPLIKIANKVLQSVQPKQ